MYQTVDDPEDIDDVAAQERARARRKLWIWLVLAAAVLLSIAIFNGNRAPVSPETEIATQAERASYRTAISEAEVDLRRARLRDFETTYPKSEYLPAVRAQLSVLDAHETKAWAVLSDVMFDPSADRITKLGAIQAYERKWGASYLGGRDSDIRALREELELEPAPLPDRELAGVASGIPKNIPDSIMVGGPNTAPPPAPPVTPLQLPPSSGKTADAVVLKNVTPRYPRRAERRGIDAVVELSLSIDADGEVQSAEVIRAQAERYESDFIKEAERAAMRTRYSPKMINGRPVPTTGVMKRYVFRLGGEE